MAGEVVLPIASDGDVVSARQHGRAMAEDAGFSAGDQTVIAAAISEVARNILTYARQGEIELRSERRSREMGIVVIARDAGPGIADLDLVMQDGYSTSGGLGLGLPGARRLMDEFDIQSGPGQGTVVTMVKWRHQ